MASELKRSGSSPGAKESGVGSARVGEGGSHWGRRRELIKN